MVFLYLKFSNGFCHNGIIRTQPIILLGIIHDALYTRKGFDIFSREECDSVLRGLMRDSGISRFKAGCADKAVEWFAGGEDHWGNDDFDNFDLISMA